jgi:outer membrane lipopolysaccharide assembly protein LptE/RlpB
MLSGCGFHLKGYKNQDAATALTSLHIRGINRYDDIAANVRQLAESRDITISPDAEWAISVNDEELERWQASTTQSASTREFFLRLQVTLQIHHKDITYQPIELAAESIFQDTADATASKKNEQEIILAELRQKLAEDILQRVQVIANNPPDCECDEPEPATAQ